MFQWRRRLRLFVVLMVGLALLQPALVLRADRAQAPCSSHVAGHTSQADPADPGSAMERDAADPGARCAAASCATPACGGLCQALPVTAAPAMTAAFSYAPPAATAPCITGIGVAPETPPPIV